MANPITTLNVSQQVAPAPTTLQRKGAIISQGATSLAPNSSKLLTQLSDLTAVLAPALNITSIAWAASVATVTTANPHGWNLTDQIPVTITGAVPAGYNGTYTATVTGASTFTFPLASNPGTETTPGTAILGDVAEVLQMATTFFAQGASLACYVLELGEGTPTEGANALGTWLTSNPGQFYSFLVPREWDNNAAFITLLGNNKSLTSQLYFFVTTTIANYAAYANIKCVDWMVENPLGIGLTEFSHAADWWVSLNYNPSSANRVTSLQYSYLQGVTPWPATGYGPQLTAIKTAGGNYVGTGAEGGISNTILIGGQTADKNPFNYWYSTDWAQLNFKQGQSAAVINGSNNTINPLYYSQAGINTLQAAAVATAKAGIGAGLAVGQIVQTQLPIAQFQANLEAGLYVNQIVINAEPFSAYTSENPGAYAAETYGGLTCQWIPQLGFGGVTFNLGVVEF